MPRESPQLFCPAGTLARLGRARLLAALTLVAAALLSVALLTPWGARGALIAFVSVWGAWMVVMPAVLIARSVRGSAR